jgi:murein DD-endopeptidase MepM/ murein hydrolase activator NlpD
MVKKVLLASTLSFFLSLQLFAQNTPIQSRSYPKNYFRYPLDLAPVTAGTFGELRPNHFHSGLDFKTMQTTGYPVHAAQDGYISRLRVEFGGFGNAIYITHPSGYTTVYGHIERFAPALEKAVRQMQETQQTDMVDFKLDPMQIEVCQGDVIAWSGNAGASAGPHLHFEIRDTKTEETINPQLFGLTIPDKVPPSLYAIGIYHLDSKPFSENTPRQFIALTGKNGSYRLLKPQVINVSGETSFGIIANDQTSASPNHNGIYSLELKVDGKTVYTYAVERFAFDETHAINAYLDYPEFLKTHRYIQKCFIPPGSKITLYPQSINRGVVNFNDDAVHAVEYIVKDVAGNTSTLDINVKSASSAAELSAAPPGTLFHYDKPNEFSNDKIRVMIAPGNLYDDLYFTYSTLPKKPGTYSAVHRIHNHLTPINDTFDLWIKPDSSIGKYTDKAVIVNTDGVCENSTYEDGYVKTQARTFGDYFIKVDTQPPFIIPLNIRNGASLKKAKSIALRIGDKLSGVKRYVGLIDRKWVLMQWDYKTHILHYYFTNEIAPGKHSFDLTVTDAKDNVAHFAAEFYR